ncbi:MAG: tRNA 2-thiouridine(34) synthase MnmA [Anaerolineales bacterium]
MSPKRTIAVAMSGGVDSSVAAALLVESGDRVFGLMLRLWSAGPERPNRCCSPRDVANASKVAGRLGIPFYVIDAKDEFKSRVVDSFISGYEAGLTPNPCLSCNRELRWGLLLERASKLGATHIATGHYARLRRTNGQYRLFRADDRQKDQSYVLSVLGQSQLAHTLFPLGKLKKEAVREIARRQGLVTANRPESQDLCFLGGDDYRTFLADHLVAAPGAIEDNQGNTLANHSGLSNFTVGQRKGIGISGPEPLYVIDKDVERNTLIVGPKSALGRTHFTVREVNWVRGHSPPESSNLTVQVRYRASAVPASLEHLEGRTKVATDEPLNNIAPGQAAVFYKGEECLGGGIISR